MGSSDQINRSKTWQFWAVLLLLQIVVIYVILESSVQLILSNRSGIRNYLFEFRDKANQQGLTLEQYGKKVGLDPFVGWGRNIAQIHDPSSAAPSRTVLFIGDSVTAGHDVRAGEEDYPTLLAKSWENQGTRVVNLAVHGYGVDQMWLKLITEARRFKPDVIVFAYIPHDLLRPASSFSFGLPKPKLKFEGNETALVLAQEMLALQESYDAAKSGFRLSGWFASYYWENKEAYLPFLFSDYYHRLFTRIGKNLANLSEDWGVPIMVVRLTNFGTFKGYERLVQLAKSDLIQSDPGAKSQVVYSDTDKCLEEMASSQGIDLQKEFAYHPGPIGHRLLAQCLGKEIEPLLKNHH